MQGGKRMAKQLGVTTSIVSTQNNVIHGIHFGQHPTFNRLNHIGSNPNSGYINIQGMGWTTSQSNHPNQQISWESSSLNSISGLEIIVGFNIIHISLEHYTTGIFSTVHSGFWDISDFGCTLMLNQCSSHAWKAGQFTAKWTLLIGGGICKISVMPERQLCQSLVHLTRLTWPIFRTISMHRRSISQLVIFNMISAGQLNSTLRSLLGSSPVPPKGAKDCDDTWHSEVESVLCPLQNLDITGPWGEMELCWSIWDTILSSFGCLGQELFRTSHHNTTLIWPMPDVWNSKTCAKWHSPHWPLDKWKAQHIYSEILDETGIDDLHTVSVHWIRDQFRNYPLSNVHPLWQPDNLH